VDCTATRVLVQKFVYDLEGKALGSRGLPFSGRPLSAMERRRRLPGESV